MPNSLENVSTSKPTLLRGASFMTNLCKSQRKKKGSCPNSPSPPRSPVRSKNVDELLMAREPTMIHSRDRLVPSPPPEKTYTVVLDLDETLVYARDGPLYARAHLKEILSKLNEYCEIVVWTAGERDYAKAVLSEINIGQVVRHLIYRHKSWFKLRDYTKDLQQLGRDMNHVLIIENTPDCVRRNPENSIIVSDFEGLAKKDSTLLNLCEIVEQLGQSGMKVPEFLAQCSLLRRQVVVSGKTEIPIYFLTSRRLKTKAGQTTPPVEGNNPADIKVVKVNRDKSPLIKATLTPSLKSRDSEEAEGKAMMLPEATTSPQPNVKLTTKHPPVESEKEKSEKACHPQKKCGNKTTGGEPEASHVASDINNGNVIPTSESTPSLAHTTVDKDQQCPGRKRRRAEMEKDVSGVENM